MKVTALCPPPSNTPFVGAAGTPPASYMATSNIRPADVASYGYRAMKRGKSVAVYSLHYKFLTSILVHITPRSALRRLLYRLNAQGAPYAALHPVPDHDRDGTAAGTDPM